MIDISKYTDVDDFLDNCEEYQEGTTEYYQALSELYAKEGNDKKAKEYQDKANKISPVVDDILDSIGILNKSDTTIQKNKSTIKQAENEQNQALLQARRARSHATRISALTTALNDIMSKNATQNSITELQEIFNIANKYRGNASDDEHQKYDTLCINSAKVINELNPNTNSNFNLLIAQAYSLTSDVNAITNLLDKLNSNEVQYTDEQKDILKSVAEQLEKNKQVELQRQQQLEQEKQQQLIADQQRKIEELQRILNEQQRIEPKKEVSDIQSNSQIGKVYVTDNQKKKLEAQQKAELKRQQEASQLQQIEDLRKEQIQAEKDKKEAEKKQKIKKISKVLIPILVVALVIYCGISAFSNRTIKINPFDYITVTFNGIEGYAYPTAELDIESIEATTHRTMVDTDVEISFDQESNLSNGDTITITIEGTDTLKQHQLALSKTTNTYTVKDLEKGEVVDPFQYLEVSFKGVDGRGTAEFTNNLKTYDANLADVTFSLKENSQGSLSNGQTVTVAVSAPKEILNKAKKGFSTTSKEYTVSGLGTLLTDISNVSDEALNKLVDSHINDIENEYLVLKSSTFCYDFLDEATMDYKCNNNLSFSESALVFTDYSIDSVYLYADEESKQVSYTEYDSNNSRGVKSTADNLLIIIIKMNSVFQNSNGTITERYDGTSQGTIYRILSFKNAIIDSEGNLTVGDEVLLNDSNRSLITRVGCGDDENLLLEKTSLQKQNLYNTYISSLSNSELITVKSY